MPSSPCKRLGILRSLLWPVCQFWKTLTRKRILSSLPWPVRHFALARGQTPDIHSRLAGRGLRKSSSEAAVVPVSGSSAQERCPFSVVVLRRLQKSSSGAAAVPASGSSAKERYPFFVVVLRRLRRLLLERPLCRLGVAQQRSSIVSIRVTLLLERLLCLFRLAEQRSGTRSSDQRGDFAEAAVLEKKRMGVGWVCA